MKVNRSADSATPKGSLQDATIEKMAKAGYNIQVSSRSYLPYVDDEEMEIRLIRAQEVSRYVEHGYLDCGITGVDWIQENGSDVHEVGEFVFSKVSRQPARWVLAVPESSLIKSPKDLAGKESPPRSSGSPGNTSGSTA
jgi:ATP phosphoribosyltransferase